MFTVDLEEYEAFKRDHPIEFALSNIFLSGVIRLEPEVPADRLFEAFPGFEDLPEDVQKVYRTWYEEDKMFLVPASKQVNAPEESWYAKSKEWRRNLYRDAVECLDLGLHDLLRQDYLQEYPELLQLDARFQKVLDALRGKPFVALSPWQRLLPKWQRISINYMVSWFMSASFHLVERDLTKYPEAIELDARLRDFWSYVLANPVEAGGKRPKWRWKQLSEESRALIVEGALEDIRDEMKADSILKGVLRSFPELRQADPRLLEFWETERAKPKSKWKNEEYPTWKELKAGDLQQLVVDLCLEQLAEGNVEYVEGELETYPELRHRDPKFMAVWRAMKKRVSVGGLDM